MGLRVHANSVSIPTQQNLLPAKNRLGRSCRRLSAGLRVSPGADGCVSSALRAQIRSIENVRHDNHDGACLVQTAEDAVAEICSYLSSPRGPAAGPSSAGYLADSSRVLDIDAAVHTLLITDENLSTAESRIRDVAVACETARRTRDSILQQAGIALLSQANALPRSAHRLLG
jgi:flagellin-like hook-associated protein FlgL